MNTVGLLLVVLLIVVLAVSFFWPHRSRKMQEKIKSIVVAVAGRSRRAGPAGGQAAVVAEKSARAVQETAHAGRRAHDEVFDSEQGAAQDEQLERRYGNGAHRGRETA